MSDSFLSFRRDEDRAVKAFRPVLRSLHLREPSEQKRIRLVKFRALSLLDLDDWSICVVQTPLAKYGMKGAFVLRHISPDPNDQSKSCGYMGYIFIERELYEQLEVSTDADLKQQRLIDIKLIGVHEFVHFLACIYAITSVSLEEARKRMYKRVQERLQDRVDEKTVREIREALDGGKPFDMNPRFNDGHYRITAGNLPENFLDYGRLYRVLLFSRELFEEEFLTEEKLEEILSNGATEAEQKREIGRGAAEVAERKSVQVRHALHRLSRWIAQYFGRRKT